MSDIIAHFLTYFKVNHLHVKYGFFIIIFLVFLSTLSYVCLRGWQALQPAGNLRIYYLVISVFLFLLMLTSLFFGNSMPPLIAKIISFAGYSYLLIMIYLMFSFIFIDFVRVTNQYIHFVTSDLVNFRLWTMIGSLIIIAVTMVIGNYNFNHPAVVQLNIQTEKAQLNKQIKIVLVSDIHLGISIDKSFLVKYVNLINSQNPDIVLIAGDFSDRGVKPLINENMKEELLKIKAPLGVYSVMGNHDFYAENEHAAADYMKESGIQVLRDTAVMINKQFYLVGRDDNTNYNRKPLNDIMKNIDRSKSIILLDHQPKHLIEAQENGVDLQLSGHTHNGQFFPGAWIVRQVHEIGYGYAKKGKTNYYISSGLGLWGPQYRIGTQSEVVVINFKY